MRQGAIHPEAQPEFLANAKHNFTVSNILWKSGDAGEVKKALKVPDDFSAFDWVVVTSYYAMYHSAMAALASVGYKSDNHTATIIALEVHFVGKNLLEREFLEKLRHAMDLEEEYVQKLRRARKQREMAQYGVTEEAGKDAAEKLLKDAGLFVNRMERLIESLK